MIKVMVVIFGLVLFVPEGEDGEGSAEKLTAIFANTNQEDHCAVHTPHITYATGGTTINEWSELNSDFALLFVGKGEEKIDLGARSSFPGLDALHRGSRVSRDCVTNKKKCDDSRNGDDLVSGTVTFTGGWSTRGATYCCGFRLKIGKHDDAMFEYRTLENPPPSEGSERRWLATALVLETEILRDSLPRELDVPVLGAESCSGWFPGWAGTEGCAVLLIGNPTTQFTSCAPGDETCRRMDRHFQALYGLLSEGRPMPGRSKLPYLVSDNAQCQTAHISVPSHWCPAEWDAELLFNRPSSYCPPGFAPIAGTESE